MLDLPKGVWPVMLTPFTQDGAIDWDGVDAITNWYIESGVAGLFAVCLSSEMYHLTEGERLALARRVVNCANGRVPVLASGTFGEALDVKVDFVKQMSETGIDATVVLACQMADEGAPEADWQKNVGQLLEATGDLPLGLYECPAPYHRVLSAEMLGWCASTDRFHLIKETSSQTDLNEAKINAVSGSSLRYYKANTNFLLASLKAGADGYCGTAANFYPDLYVWICHYFESEPEMAAELDRFLSVANYVVKNKYKTSAKQFLKTIGLPIHPVCRDQKVDFKEDELMVFEHLRDLVDAQRDALGILAPEI